jgi:putative ABC transport system permease protein
MGASNRLIVSSALLQMVVVTAVGVAAGSIGAWLLSLAVPATLPLVWPLNTVVATVASLIVMGPLGGLLSVRIILRVEPLTALGLAK